MLINVQMIIMMIIIKHQSFSYFEPIIISIIFLAEIW